MTTPPSAGDAITSGAGIIEVRVAELRQLFNAMDPSPFHNRDLDLKAEEYIVSWSRELPRDAKLGLLVHLDRPVGAPDEVAVLRDAIHWFFSERSVAARKRLRQLFQRGRISLLIGLAFLGIALVASQLIESFLNPGGFIKLLRESLLIGGWVAMWRPIEIFLYDWWPIHAEVRLFERLATMPVRIKYASDKTSEPWRRDWPAVPAMVSSGQGHAEGDPGDAHSNAKMETRALARWEGEGGRVRILSPATPHTFYYPRRSPR